MTPTDLPAVRASLRADEAATRYACRALTLRALADAIEVDTPIGQPGTRRLIDATVATLRAEADNCDEYAGIAGGAA